MSTKKVFDPAGRKLPGLYDLRAMGHGAGVSSAEIDAILPARVKPTNDAKRRLMLVIRDRLARYPEAAADVDFEIAGGDDEKLSTASPTTATVRTTFAAVESGTSDGDFDVIRPSNPPPAEVVAVPASGEPKPATGTAVSTPGPLLGRRRVRLRDILPNPFRDLRMNPKSETKVEALTRSIRETSFWADLVARPCPSDPGKLEIPYGYHRLEAARQVWGANHEIDITVRDLNDETMLKMMAHENMDEWRHGVATVHEAVRATVLGYADGRVELPPVSEKTPRKDLRYAPSFVAGDEPQGDVGGQSANIRPYTASTMAEFLGWVMPNGRPQDRVKDALAALELVEQGQLAHDDFVGLGTRAANAIIREARARRRKEEDGGVADGTDEPDGGNDQGAGTQPETGSVGASGGLNTEDEPKAEDKAGSKTGTLSAEEDAPVGGDEPTGEDDGEQDVADDADVADDEMNGLLDEADDTDEVEHRVNLDTAWGRVRDAAGADGTTVDRAEDLLALGGVDYCIESDDLGEFQRGLTRLLEHAVVRLAKTDVDEAAEWLRATMAEMHEIIDGYRCEED